MWRVAPRADTHRNLCLPAYLQCVTKQIALYLMSAHAAESL